MEERLGKMSDISFSLSSVTAAILAGGYGTRLRSVVSDRPKILADVNGRPFVTFLLDQLRHAGVRRAVLCTGYLGEQIKETLGSSHNGIELLYSREQSPMGTGGAIRLALPMLHSEPILIMNGDSFCHADLAGFLRFHKSTHANASLLMTKVGDVGRYGSVRITEKGEIELFEEKGGNTGSGYINAGIYLLNQSIVQSIPFGTPVSLERDVFPGLIKRGLYGFQDQGRFIDIGIPEDYDKAQGFFEGYANMPSHQEGL